MGENGLPLGSSENGQQKQSREANGGFGTVSDAVLWDKLMCDGGMDPSLGMMIRFGSFMRKIHSYYKDY